MSTAEIVTAILGLLLGYGIISRWIGQRSPQAPETGAPAAAAPDDLNSEWIRANWHEILGVSPNASADVIKTAYRLRVEQYRPDKAEGLGPELRSLAARKTRELDAAYAWAISSRSAGP